MFTPCETKSCVTLSIEDDLGITTTQRIDVILKSTDDRIVLNQTNGDIEISRAPGKYQSVDLLIWMMPTFPLALHFCQQAYQDLRTFESNISKVPTTRC